VEPGWLVGSFRLDSLRARVARVLESLEPPNVILEEAVQTSLEGVLAEN
jgi:hypothetical protein